VHQLRCWLVQLLDQREQLYDLRGRQLQRCRLLVVHQLRGRQLQRCRRLVVHHLRGRQVQRRGRLVVHHLRRVLCSRHVSIDSMHGNDEPDVYSVRGRQLQHHDERVELYDVHGMRRR
jgi:hypothetical protein